jgi:hypothetical protein
MRHRCAVLTTLILLTATACREAASPLASQDSSVVVAPIRVLSEEGRQPYCDEVDAIPDSGCIERTGGSGFDEYYDYVALADNSIMLDMAFAQSTAPLPICIPRFTMGLVPGTVFPSTGGMVSFVSSGTWVLLSIFDIVGRIGTYDWPDGWWPSNSGDGLSVSVDSADGVCDLSISGRFRINFFSFNGVAYRRPRPPGGGAGVPTGPPGGGGSGGSGGNSGPETDVLFECMEWTEPDGTYHLFCQRV